jgi:hypothetical protein
LRFEWLIVEFRCGRTHRSRTRRRADLIAAKPVVAKSIAAKPVTVEDE